MYNFFVIICHRSFSSPSPHFYSAGLFALDQVGHGYSEGDRSYIRYYSYLLDDATQLLRTILVDDPALSRFTEKVRFQIVGQSMGGTLTAALGILINGCKNVGYFNDESQISFLHSLKSRYAGSILLCPALSLSLPPFLILLTMQYCVVPLFPATEIPTFLSDVKPKEFAWKDRKYIEYIRSDGFPNNPKGISWSGAIRFATAQSILDLIAVVRDLISTGSNHFPFVVMHDPDDQVCSYNGSKFLIECSQSSSHQHDLVDMPDGFHDLWTNKIDFICEYIIKNC
jgi:pimeloyl-ACP methyl ester carboxylesterase